MSSKDEQELSSFDLLSAKMSDAQKLTGEVHDLLKQDLDKVRREKSAFEEMTKTLNQVHFGSTVKLNVGGKIYKTTLDTLRKDPDSMLCVMFSGRHQLKADEDDGAYFIDRDSELFRYILNYLRNGELFCPNDEIMKKELLAEARFYQVQGIIALLEGKSLRASIILKSGWHRSAVTSWLPPGATCSVLYRATTDGKMPADFHRCCDNKGPTLIVVQSDEYIYGGYTSKSWASPPSTTATTDSESFLFSLVNPSGIEPVKITPKQNVSAGIRCRVDLGPRFGNKDSTDFHLWQINNGVVQLTGYLNLNICFACPQNADKNNLFTGKNPFEITEIEVFKIEVH